MTVSIRRDVVYCGGGGELKDGRPAFYKYPYSCVLSCKLCRNWLEQGCVFYFRDKSVSVVQRTAVQHKCPTNGCLKFGVVVMGAGATAHSAVNHHQEDAETTSPFSPRWGGAVMTVNYCLVKNVTLSIVAKKPLWIWTVIPQQDQNIHWLHGRRKIIQNIEIWFFFFFFSPWRAPNCSAV